jgi:Galactose oxidase, central domain
MMESTPHRSWRALALAVLVGAVAACGGGGSGKPAPDGPAILQFDPDRSSYGVGDTARLTVRYARGVGRIEPGIGQVANGVTVDTPPLDSRAEYELIVESAQGVARRRLTLPVAYRERYRKTASGFAAAGHSAVLAGDGSVLIIGGSRGLSAVSDSIDRFDPRTERFTKIGSLAGGARLGETATRLSSGRILIAGGLRMVSGNRNSELIDEVTGAVALTGAMNAARLGHTAMALAGDRVLITGGYSDEAFPGISPTAEIWEPSTGKFRLLQRHMLRPRAHHTATRLDDGRVLIVGGFSYTPPYVLAEIFDPVTETFTAVPSNEQTERGLHESVKLGDGHVLVLGGEDEAATTFHRSVLLWNRTSGVFETMPDLLAPRSLIRAAATRRDQVLLFGGTTHADPSATASAEVYVRTVGALPAPPMPVPRAWHTVTRLNDGRVLIVGGQDASGALLHDVLIYE